MKLYKYNISDFTGEDFTLWYSLMSPEKQSRIDSYRNEKDKIRSVCGHMLALKGISEHTGLPFDKILLAEDKNGKPYCEGISVFFSISHSDEKVICAVDSRPVGADIEKIRPVRLSAALRICSPSELEYIFGKIPSGAELPLCEDKEILTRFFEIWVKKEALGKKEGCGIAYDMKKQEVLSLPCFYDGDYILAVL